MSSLVKSIIFKGCSLACFVLLVLFVCFVVLFVCLLVISYFFILYIYFLFLFFIIIIIVLFVFVCFFVRGGNVLFFWVGVCVGGVGCFSSTGKNTPSLKMTCVTKMSNLTRSNAKAAITREKSFCRVCFTPVITTNLRR